MYIFYLNLLVTRYLDRYYRVEIRASLVLSVTRVSVDVLLPEFEMFYPSANLDNSFNFTLNSSMSVTPKTSGADSGKTLVTFNLNNAISVS
jgi:hypothetical protein